MRKSNFTSCLPLGNIVVKLLFPLNFLFFLVLIPSLPGHAFGFPSNKETNEILNAPTVENISGKIITQDGTPIPGASVIEKGTSNGVTTDQEGDFSIAVKDKSSVLVISAVGFQTEEIAAASIQNGMVTLVPKQQALDEVVVVGYGTQARRNVTGSVATVKGDELVRSPVTTLTNALVGRLPGLRAVQPGGEPGYDGSNIDIRGFGAALLIVDGVPSDFSQLDPNEIESFSVLKDASAAVYGIRAANGVILVTTKKGKTGPPQIDYNTYFGIQSITKYPDLADAALFAELSNEGAVNAWVKNNNPTTDLSFPFSKETLEQYRNGTLPSTDWFGATIRKHAPQQYHNVNVRGGTEAVRYFFNVGYTNQQGMWKSGSTSYKRYNIRSNIDAKIAKGITATLNLGARFEDRARPGSPKEVLMGAIQRSFPTFPIYANDNPDYFAPNNNPHMNPVFLSDRNNSGYETDVNRTFSGILTLQYDLPFVQGLNLKVQYSYESDDKEIKEYTKKYQLYSYDPDLDQYNVAYVGNDPTRLGSTTHQIDKQVLQGSVNYARQFGEHKVAASYIYEKQSATGSDLGAYKEFLLQNLDELFAGVAANQSNGGSSFERARMGHIGKINYDYLGKYLLEFGFRYDGSYKFPSNSRFGFFPNVSAGWRISDENFLKDVSALDDLKLRASWGKVGDDGGDDYWVANYIWPFQYLTGYNYPSGTYIFGNNLIPGLIDAGMANPALTWFNSTTRNIGIDVTLFKGLIGMNLDVFHRERKGLLAYRYGSLPNTFGASLPQENLNGDNTRGFELILTHQGKIGELRYSVSPNLTWTRTKNGYLERRPSNNDMDNWRNNGIDRWSNLWWGYVATGQFQSQEEINKAPVQDNNSNKTLLPGDIRYQDLNNDGIIDGNDVTIIGRGSTPETFFGLNLSASYKGFDFSLLLQGATNFNAYYNAELQNPFFNNANSLTMFGDRWRRADLFDPNSEWIPGKYPSTVISGSDNNKANSSFWLQDATYLRVKNFDLGYTLPRHLVNKATIRNVRIYISGQNIFTFDKVKFIDPEAESGRGTYYPQQKVWTIGANIGF